MPTSQAVHELVTISHLREEIPSTFSVAHGIILCYECVCLGSGGREFQISGCSTTKLWPEGSTEDSVITNFQQLSAHKAITVV